MFWGDLDVSDPDIGRKQGVQSSVKLRDVPAWREGNRRHLSRCVNSAIGSPGAHYRISLSGEFPQGTFEFTLYGSPPGLELPAHEVGPIVLKGQAETAVAVEVHADKVEWWEGTSRKTGRPSRKLCAFGPERG